MIHIEKDGTGCFRGDKCKIIGFDGINDIVQFEYLDGHKSGDKFGQPRESVLLADKVRANNKQDLRVLRKSVFLAKYYEEADKCQEK